MYNTYSRNSEAWGACDEADDAMKDLDGARDNVEGVFRSLCDSLEQACSERDEWEEQCREVEEERDEYKEKYAELHGATDLVDVISLMTNIKVAGEAMARYATERLVQLGALNETQDTDGSGGSGSDGGGQVNAAEGIERATAEGISRPQIP